ncbi:hypothetical protein [Spirosoma sp. KNUC1025]|uniref:hypothetical protein n=1 Tax=Spirosoma sp. KNUC1025 TaxID=2894082 RepID=UPI003870D341|nr:hypothetical protein LN737_15205 [Spirosoma sp. KNUC1025]
MRKGTFPRADELRRVITKIPPPYYLYYSSAHLADYLKDTSDHKNDDLRFMGEIGILHNLAYNPNIRMCGLGVRSPIDAFYNGRLTKEQATQHYEKYRKPALNNEILSLYEWFKATLIEYEKDESYLNKLDSMDANAFLSVLKEVKLSSDTITPELFVENSEKFTNEELLTLSEKEASRFILELSVAESDYLKYKNEVFDLSQPNLIEQIKDSEFKRNLQDFIEQSVYNRGEDFNRNYNEINLFINTYGVLQILGVEPDKAKKFNIYSTREDAAHFYFASTCNYLITEDDGLYRRAKILYGVLNVTTKVFRIGEFLDYIG